MTAARCEPLMRSGHEPKARVLWDTARTDFPDDVWIFVQAGIEYHDLGDHPTALSWLTPGVWRHAPVTPNPHWTSSSRSAPPARPRSGTSPTNFRTARRTN
jgi:hypothetical protein